ncbi:MAG: pyridoxal phosphate-dependent aminotransferase [Thermodesulfobacteriota bacterium]|nr:pyridoxal phosphate-dependent aminotransferase [Thermodesulfobacteriota bacterium]
MKNDISPAMFIGVEGDDIISFGSGQPDLPPPNAVYDILPDYSKFKYGLIQGQKNLRDALSGQYPCSDARNFVITNGASEALDLVLRAIFLGSDDARNKVLLTRPFYYSYPHIVRFAGMEPVYTDLKDGRIDMADFEEKIQGCKAVVINSPSNPTGRVESVQTLKRVEELTARLGVYVLSDEVYKDLIYVRENYIIKGDHVVTINSFSKTYAMCGFRVGYLWSLDQDLVDRVIEIKTHTSMNTNILGQEMAFEATKVPRTFIDNQLRIWEQRRDLLYNGLKDLGLDLWRPEGAFYVLPQIPDPKAFVMDMFDRYKVITYLGEWFGAPERVRFSYALDVDKIEKGLTRIEDYLRTR